MICPTCSGRDFSPVKMEGGLPAERCTACDGVWVELERYKLWRKSMPQVAAHEAVGDIDDSNGAVRLCPSTGRLMIRIRVTHDNPLMLDYSWAAQAVWFDQGEWERLIGLGLHDQLDAIVSERWQASLKLAASQERTDKRMREHFGEGYDELVKMRAWLATQPNKSEMIAFLTSNTD